MKKLLIFFIATLFLSCNDGDFDIPAFDFETEVTTCGEFVLYRTNQNKTEVIVLTLDNDVLGTEIGEESINLSSTATIIYRVFDEGIGSSYFCQDIPPTSPTVLKELNVSEGTIYITTSEGATSGYRYNIVINDLVFIDGKERISFTSFDFGELEIAD